MKAIRKGIKEDGRGETEHHPEIPSETLDAIWSLCGKLEKLLEAKFNLDQSGYNEALRNLPEKWRNNWHNLLRICIQFIVTMFDIRRGVEGIETLTKEHFQFFEENGKKTFQKVIC